MNPNAGRPNDNAPSDNAPGDDTASGGLVGDLGAPADAPAGEVECERPKPPLPRWVALVFLAVCAALVPQILHLSSTLAQIELANHWRMAWVGLDIGEAVVFLLTAWFLFRASVLVTVTASMAAAMIWVDAWFDVMTALRQPDVDTATNLAFFAEIPLGLFCLYVAIRPLRRLRQAARGRSRADAGS
jgi:hypothetical protein